MNNTSIDKKENALKIPLRTRLKYMFSGYKTQIFIDSVRKKAPIYILAILIVLVVVYIFLHPIDKIKLRYFITRDCTIEIISKNTPHNSNWIVPSESKSEILIDGDWIEADGKYYNVVNGEVYRCFKDKSGTWQKELYEIDINSSIGAKLLDKNNYVIDKKNPFIWKLKEDIDKEILSLDNICIKRFQGSIAIVGETVRNGYTAEVYVCFRGFGTTDIEFPWDE